MTLPISLTDVTLRDGLQAELKVVSTENKIKLFSLLLDCGYSRLEITSFVHPKWIPQLSDSEAFCESLFKQNPNPKTELMAFVPNEKGLDRLLSFPIPWASAFVAASETFNKKNVNTSIAETLTELRKVVKKTHAAKRKIRIYISTVFGCPYEGKIPLESLFSTLQKVIDLGADEIALSDTIGVAVPPQTTEILKRFSAIFPVAKTALHFHNTYGLALSNIQCGYDLGIRSFDGSTGGIGGCPYAKGATGNVAIEEIAYLFSREENYKNFRAASIRKAQEFLLKDLDLSLHGHLAEIWNKGGRFMALADLVVRREGGVVIATLNRPDKMNALNKALIEDLKRLIDVLETDKVARVLILTGSGEKAFCVGADLKERQGMNEKDILLRLEFVRTLFIRMEKLPLPIIAAINGTALGGGLELALACDLRVASENAVLGVPETDLAIIPGSGGTQRLGRLIGMSGALEMILLAKRISAHEAEELGIVNHVSPVGQAVTHAMTWANKMSEAGPIAIRQAKAAVRQGLERSLEHGLEFEIECYKACLYSKDRVEGLKAFSEKRKPVYRGE